MLILIKYGTENPAENWKLEMSAADDVIVLIQNGVFWAVTAEGKKALAGKKVYALKADLEARGYAEQDCPVEAIDYSGLIELLEQNEKRMS